MWHPPKTYYVMLRAYSFFATNEWSQGSKILSNTWFILIFKKWKKMYHHLYYVKIKCATAMWCHSGSSYICIPPSQLLVKDFFFDCIYIDQQKSLGVIHKRRWNFFGCFWYRVPSLCWNFDPELPHFYLLISCNILNWDPP